MSGSASTARWLIAQGLLDELALLVHPIAVAPGQRLFEGTGTVPLRLLESRRCRVACCWCGTHLSRPDLSDLAVSGSA